VTVGERWLILIIFTPVALVIVTVILVRIQQWRRARAARDTNDRINRLP
jgi:hypothetical protein